METGENSGNCQDLLSKLVLIGWNILIIIIIIYVPLSSLMVSHETNILKCRHVLKCGNRNQ